MRPETSSRLFHGRDEADVFSAWGMLTLDVVSDYSRTAVADLETIDPAFVEQQFRELTDEAVQAFDRDEIPAERRAVFTVARRIAARGAA